MDSLLPSIQYGLLTQDFPNHNHDRWEIHLFTGGGGRFVQGGRSWTVGPGIISFSPPSTDHSLAVDRFLSFYYLKSAGEREVSAVLHRLVDRQTSEGPFRVDPSLVVEAGRLKDRLDSPLADLVTSGLHGFRAWLYDLAARSGEAEPDGVDQTLVWLRQNLDRRLELDDLATVAGLDRFVFSRRFKARTGLSPLAYVHRSKIEAACFLLAGTDLPLAEVAQRLGYCDEFHFGKVFKKWRGVTPGRWRRPHS